IRWRDCAGAERRSVALGQSIMLRGRGRYHLVLRTGVAVMALLLAHAPAGAGTLGQAPGLSYQSNPQLNAQRAAARATDENVAIALGGYRPRLTATGSLSEVYLENVARVTAAPGFSKGAGENAVTTVGATGTQTLFNGFQTGN